MPRRTGSVQPTLDQDEHVEAAVAKRTVIVGLDDSGTNWLSPTVFDFSGTADALAVKEVTSSGEAIATRGEATTVNSFTTVTVTTSATLLIAANTSRKQVIFARHADAGTAKIVVGPDNTVTSSKGIEIPEAGANYFSFGDGMWNGAWYGIVDSGSLEVTVIEFE
jgi:hypothetical protein